MKEISAALLLSVVACAADDIKTIDGAEYKGVTISRAEPDGLVIVTDSGIEKLPFTRLDKATQEKYHYDPSKAAKFTAAVNQAAHQRYMDNYEAQTFPSIPQISAIALNAAYESNEVAADRDYKGKFVEVTGRIQSISTDILGAPFVSLKTEGLDVTCAFSKDSLDYLATLHAGKLISIAGIVRGLIIGVVLKDCTVRAIEETPR